MNDLIRPHSTRRITRLCRCDDDPGARGCRRGGPVCETGDFFARDRKLAPVQAGDLVALLDAGAYGMAQSSNYNTRPVRQKCWSSERRRG